jgi:integrase
MEIEEGKYISLGHSIQVRLSTKGIYSYFHSYRDENKKVRRRPLFTSKKCDSKNLKRAIIESDTPPELTKKVVKKKITTLNDLADKYFKSRYKKKRNKLKQEYNHLTPKEFEESKIVKQRLKSIKGEEGKYFRNVSKSNVAKINVLNLSKQKINDYIYEYLPEKNLSTNSAAHIINLIKTIFNYAIRNELINIANPFQNIIYKKEKPKKRRSLTVEELTLLLKTCKEHNNPNVYLAVYLGVLTAARATMILNIRKKDINIKTQEIKLNNYKGDKKYRLTLNKESIDWLDKKYLQYLNPEDFLIRSTNKHYLPETPQPLSEMPDAIYEIMDELFNKDLNKQDNSDREDVINFHSIRRTVATNMAEQGTSIYDIMVLLDHSSIKQTQEYLSLSHRNLSKETNKFLSNVFIDTKKIYPDIPF